MERFTLTAWKAPKPFQSNVTTTAQWIDDYYPDDKEVVTTAAANIQETFDPVKEFPQLFRKEIPCELPPVRGISHKIIPKPGASWVPAFRPVGDPFKKEITEKINEELASGRIYRADDDTNAVVMFTQPKDDDPSKPRFLLQAQPRNMCV